MLVTIVVLLFFLFFLFSLLFLLLSLSFSFSLLLSYLSMFTQFLYVVFDSTAQAVSGPIIMLPSDPVAIRMFSDAVLNPNSIFVSHPDDYKLIKVGAIVMQSGAIAPLEDHEVVITARTVVDLANRSEVSE